MVCSSGLIVLSVLANVFLRVDERVRSHLERAALTQQRAGQWATRAEVGQPCPPQARGRQLDGRMRRFRKKTEL